MEANAKQIMQGELQENEAAYAYAATEKDVPKTAQIDDCYIKVNVCKQFDFQINMQKQKPDVWSGWAKGSEALHTLIDHSIRIKAADALRSAMSEIFGEKTEDIRNDYTAYAVKIAKDTEKLSKLRAMMIEWIWEGKVSKPKTLEQQLAETIAAQGKIVNAAKAGKFTTHEEKAQAKAALIALTDKRDALEKQLAESDTDLDSLFE